MKHFSKQTKKFIASFVSINLFLAQIAIASPVSKNIYLNSDKSQLLASNLNANNINLTTTDKNSINITGSNLNSNHDINIITGDLNLKSSQDSFISNENSKEISGSISYTMYGGGGGSAGLNYANSHSSSENIFHNNANLYALNNINITTANDANFIGANIRADNEANLNIGGDLNLISQRDKYQANSKSSSIGVGTSFNQGKNSYHFADGTANLSSANANYSNSKSNSIIKQTNLSSITANNLNINVKGNTHLKGSMIAAGEYDNDGNFIDNAQLNLKTNTLTFENLANTSYNKGTNLNISANLALGGHSERSEESQKQNNSNLQNSNTDLNSKITGANYANSRSLGYSSSKTLATIGQGNLIISDTQNSDDLDRLNRNTDEINKDLYNTSISSNIQASIDTRLFTEDGREQIGQDINEVRQGLGEFALKAMLGSENYEKTKVINNELAKLKETDPQRYKEIIIAINEYNKAQEASKDNAIPVVIPVASVVTDFLVEIGIISVAASGAYGAKKLGDKYNSGDFTDNGLDFGDTDVKQSKTNNQNNNQANTQSNSNAQASSPAPLPPDDDDDDENFKNNKSKKSDNIPDGFKETKEFGYNHGQKIYKYNGKYYSKDIDSHNGGEWKVFEKVGGKLKRIGTADKDLNIFKR